MTYRSFPHAKAATVFSWTTGVLSALSALAAIVIGLGLILAKLIPERLDLKIFKFRYEVNSDWIKLEVILIIAAVLLMLASKFIGRKIAELTIRRKIKKSVKFAYNYCCEDPSSYKYAASLNKDFARKYGLELNTLTIVERSKYRKR
jgi:hypothetical protein